MLKGGSSSCSRTTNMPLRACSPQVVQGQAARMNFPLRLATGQRAMPWHPPHLVHVELWAVERPHFSGAAWVALYLRAADRRQPQVRGGGGGGGGRGGSAARRWSSGKLSRASHLELDGHGRR